MQHQLPFDALDWLATNALGGESLSPEAHKAVGDFTMMWNFFESLACANKANVRAFERLVERVDVDRLPASIAQTVEDCVFFWTFRYRTSDGFSERFLGLNFRPNDRRDHVELVLRGVRSDIEDKLLALAIIVYRLRNNLFHGIKTLDMLNDQVSNLSTASRCLGALLSISRSYLVRDPRDLRSTA